MTLALPVPGVSVGSIRAVSANVTVLAGGSAGYVAVFSHGSAWAGTSNVNVLPGMVVANEVVTRSTLVAVSTCAT